MAKTKILFIIPSLQSGGSERVMSLLVNALDTGRFEPILIVIDPENPFYAIDKDRVRVIELGVKRVRQAFFPILKIIRAEQPNVVVSTLTHLNIFMALVRPFFSKKIRFIARESVVISTFHRLQNHTWLRDVLVKILYRRFDTLICQSKDMANDLIENYKIAPRQIQIVNNPVDTEGVFLKAEASVLPKKKAKFRFVSVGRLAHQKGFDRALLALSQLQNIDFEYFIVGGGELENELKSQAVELGIGERVHFLGVQSNPFGWMASADLYLLPSRFEGFPNVLIEAGACGTPTVAFACKGGIDEIIESGLNGFAVEDDNIAAFSAAILRGCQMDFDRRKIRELTRKRFDSATIVGRYEAIFSFVIQ